MDKNTEKELNALDSTIFSSDAFFDEAALDTLEKYLRRWSDECERLRTFIKEWEDEDEDEETLELP